MHELFKKIEQYIRLLDENIHKHTGDAISGMIISSSEYGTLMLDEEETKLYRDHLNLLIDVFLSDYVSSIEIERLFKKAILVGLSIKKNSTSSFDERMNIAIRELIGGLKSSPRAYYLYYPVNGLMNSELPQQFGRVKFVLFDNKLIQEYYDQVKDVFENYTEEKKKLIFDYTNEQLSGKAGGIIPASATDPVAAEDLALRELHSTIDTINFFSDLLSGVRAFLYLPGERERILTPSLLTSDVPQQYSSIGTSVKGPIAPLSLSTLYKNSKFGFPRANKLLIEQKGELQGRLLAALQWAGRATTDARSEEAFLLYAIALESIMLSDNERDELQYRLSLRVGHLLGKDAQSRKQIVDQVKDLYKIRSQIVHSGKFRITDSNLQQIRLITKKSILKILEEESFLNMQTPKEFASWFETKILG